MTYYQPRTLRAIEESQQLDEVFGTLAKAGSAAAGAVRGAAAGGYQGFFSGAKRGWKERAAAQRRARNLGKAAASRAWADTAGKQTGELQRYRAKTGRAFERGRTRASRGDDVPMAGSPRNRATFVGGGGSDQQGAAPRQSVSMPPDAGTDDYKKALTDPSHPHHVAVVHHDYRKRQQNQNTAAAGDGGSGPSGGGGGGGSASLANAPGDQPNNPGADPTPTQQPQQAPAPDQPNRPAPEGQPARSTPTGKVSAGSVPPPATATQAQQPQSQPKKRADVIPTMTVPKASSDPKTQGQIDRLSGQKKPAPAPKRMAEPGELERAKGRAQGVAAAKEILKQTPDPGYDDAPVRTPGVKILGRTGLNMRRPSEQPKRGQRKQFTSGGRARLGTGAVPRRADVRLGAMGDREDAKPARRRTRKTGTGPNEAVALARTSVVLEQLRRHRIGR